MGHTVTSQRQVVDAILADLADYRKSLRIDERLAFDRAVDKVKIHIGSISYTTTYNTWALVLFSMILEQEKELMKLESDINGRLQIKR